MLTETQYQNFVMQFITHHNDKHDYIEGAELALKGGCKWIQLRMKDAPKEQVAEYAAKLLPLCRQHEATLIIDDHVDVCMQVGADGVHLGKKDMNPAEARSIMGSRYIIGGTCNTYNDIVAVKDSVDYIGCGPFRFTTTKQGLAPTLGLEGYRDIVWQCRSNGINIPIVAIGGILRNDIADVLAAGANGIALSGAVLNADDPARETELVMQTIYGNPLCSFLNSIPDCGI